MALIPFLRVIEAEGGTSMRRRLIQYPEKMDKSAFFNKEGCKNILNENGLALITNLTSIGLAIDEIVPLLGCSKQLLYEEHNRDAFKNAYDLGKTHEIVLIRKALIDACERGSDNAIIFACKSILGMSDKQPPKVDTSALDGFIEAMERERAKHTPTDEPRTYAEFVERERTRARVKAE